jgi:hypothetical protein
MVVEDLLGNVEQFEQLRIADGVVNVLSVFSGAEDVAIPQNCQLLGKVALLYVEPGTEIVDPGFALSELIEDSNPQGMSKGFKEFGFKLTDFSHLIFEY